MGLGYSLSIANFGTKGGISDAADGSLPAMHTDGMLAEWLFAEGSGTTVADSVAGAYPINLNLPTNPNYTWTPRGVSLAAGMVQTPNIAGVRTVVFLYKIARGDTGVITCGGASNTTFWTGQFVMIAPEKAHIGYGAGVKPVRHRANTAGSVTGESAFQVGRGGWALGFREYAAATGATPLSFGGRYNLTTSRATTLELAAAWVYNDQLTDLERTQIYDHVRAWALPRGIYLDYRDCPVQADAMLIWGQSNAVGRSPISGLSAPDQAQTYSRVLIEPCNYATRGTPPAATLALGTNQTLTNPATAFGPEIGAALLREADTAAKPLYIVKTSEGSTYLAPASVGAPVATSNTWHPTTDAPASVYHNAITRDWPDIEQSALNAGIGLRLRGVLWVQGEQDAILAVAAAAYQTSLAALIADSRVYSGYPDLPFAIVRISYVQTYVADVRAAMDAVIAADPTRVFLVDTDGLTFFDGVHYDAPSMKTVGARGYNALGLTS